jgi:hypothetical protein
MKQHSNIKSFSKIALVQNVNQASKAVLTGKSITQNAFFIQYERLPKK